MQYPYKLYKKTIVGSGADVNGNAVGGNEQWVFVCDCRDERSNGKKVTTIDGSVHDFTAKVFMSINCPDVPVGNDIQIKDIAGHIRLQADVIMFDRGQYHCRIWL